MRATRVPPWRALRAAPPSGLRRRRRRLAGRGQSQRHERRSV